MYNLIEFEMGNCNFVDYFVLSAFVQDQNASNPLGWQCSLYEFHSTDPPRPSQSAAKTFSLTQMAAVAMERRDDSLVLCSWSFTSNLAGLAASLLN